MDIPVKIGLCIVEMIYCDQFIKIKVIYIYSLSVSFQEPKIIIIIIIIKFSILLSFLESFSEFLLKT